MSVRALQTPSRSTVRETRAALRFALRARWARSIVRGVSTRYNGASMLHVIELSHGSCAPTPTIVRGGRAASGATLPGVARPLALPRPPAAVSAAAARYAPLIVAV